VYPDPKRTEGKKGLVLVGVHEGTQVGRGPPESTLGDDLAERAGLDDEAQEEGEEELE